MASGRPPSPSEGIQHWHDDQGQQRGIFHAGPIRGDRLIFTLVLGASTPS
ncbi:hypothetical protein RISK_001711 [Rhodopirellula islandica]|uniref:Uncharacterized protein n=1 Tax=Rhodopirellula islandica TaxID=595434 RepID=A0A0J1BIZ3_RHOIS|nr:hypothetical protein RISK_001711 [Rhodopirellula islandica]